MGQPQKIVILGAGGFAREVLWVFREANGTNPQWEVLGFVDEDKSKHGEIICDLPVLGGFDWFKRGDGQKVRVLSGVGSTLTKQHLADVSKRLGLDFCSLVHPDARMSTYVSIGPGTVITAGNIITTQVSIGDHVTVNLNCTIGHDCDIGNYSTLAPGTHLSGNCRIGEGVELGTGCIVLPGITIGRWSTVGAGGVVINDLPEYSFAVGVPAKVIRIEKDRDKP
jgi:sugar O-acyltransferase (sialic acid O-acetyltransferase NeuD family)